jgi:hypothetical protein
MTDTRKPTPDQLQQLFAELGRCLYLYQSIEHGLKLVLPHMLPSEEALQATDDNLMNWRSLLDSKKTLGLLVQLLKERIESDNKHRFEDDLRQLVEYRNEIVHLFLAQPFGNLRTESQFAEAMQYLKTRRQFAIPMFRMVQQLSVTFVKILDDIDTIE